MKPDRYLQARVNGKAITLLTRSEHYGIAILGASCPASIAGPQDGIVNSVVFTPKEAVEVVAVGIVWISNGVDHYKFNDAFLLKIESKTDSKPSIDLDTPFISNDAMIGQIISSPKSFHLRIFQGGIEDGKKFDTIPWTFSEPSGPDKKPEGIDGRTACCMLAGSVVPETKSEPEAMMTAAPVPTPEPGSGPGPGN